MPYLTDEQIERAIDADGLPELLLHISLICDEKADHIRINWQDNKTARPWATTAKRLEKSARDAMELSL